MDENSQNDQPLNINQEQTPVPQTTEQTTPPMPETISNSFENNLPKAKAKFSPKLLIIIFVIVVILIITAAILFSIFGNKNTTKTATKADSPTSSAPTAKNEVASSDTHTFRIYTTGCIVGGIESGVSIALEKNTDEQYLARYYGSSEWVDIMNKDSNGNYIGQYNKITNLSISFNDTSLTINRLDWQPSTSIQNCLDSKNNTLTFSETKNVKIVSGGEISQIRTYPQFIMSYKTNIANGTSYLPETLTDGTVRYPNNYKITISDKSNLGFLATLSSDNGTSCSDYFPMMDIDSSSGLAGNFEMDSSSMTEFDLLENNTWKDGKERPGYGFKANCGTALSHSSITFTVK